MSLPPAWPLRARVALLALLPLLAAPSVQAAAAAAAQLDQRGHSTVPQQLCDPLQHGAKGDGTTDDTRAIAAAVAACRGGGVVLLAAGRTFISGPFNLTSHQVLRVEGTLRAPAVPDLARWPRLPHFPSYQLSRSGHWTRYAPLVGAYNQTNITIDGAGGTGTIDGQGAWWWDAAVTRNALSAERPRLVEPEWVRGFVVQGITLTQSPYWTLHPIYCDDVRVSNAVI